jgi:RNase P subunit RPR2
MLAGRMLVRVHEYDCTPSPHTARQTGCYCRPPISMPLPCHYAIHLVVLWNLPRLPACSRQHRCMHALNTRVCMLPAWQRWACACCQTPLRTGLPCSTWMLAVGQYNVTNVNNACAHCLVLMWLPTTTAMPDSYHATAPSRYKRPTAAAQAPQPARTRLKPLTAHEWHQRHFLACLEQ